MDSTQNKPALRSVRNVRSRWSEKGRKVGFGLIGTHRKVHRRRLKPSVRRG